MSDPKPGTRVKVSFEGVVEDLDAVRFYLDLEEDDENPLDFGFIAVRDNTGNPGTVHFIWPDKVVEVIPPPLPDVYAGDVWASHDYGHYLVHASAVHGEPLFQPVRNGGPIYGVDEFFAKFPNAELKFSSWNS